MKRLTNSEIKARLILIVGIALAVAFLGSTAALLYGLLFVVQPIDKVSPNDDSAWALLSPMMLFLTGALSGILASNGLKDKEQKDD
jgi:hypothetical protein